MHSPVYKPNKMKKVQKMMTDELLFRYFSNEASEEEVARIECWLEENPSHQKDFDAAHFLFNATVLRADEMAVLRDSGKERKVRRITVLRRKILRYAAVAAAVIVAGVAGVLGERELSYRKMTAQTNILEVPAGQRMSVTLNDGTRICLNGNSRIEYPAVFGRGERRVKLSGEAFLDVTHDEDHPFVVETYVSEVEVLGTKFSVYASEEINRFAATLQEGCVRVTTTGGGRCSEQVVLSPDEKVRLENNHLTVSDIDAEESMSWTDGYINLRGVTFPELMERFEYTYGVNIVVDRDEMPQIGWRSGKIRVSEGVDFALRLLQKACDFTYTVDSEANTITIR